jgi:hypothetical protein
MRDHDNRTKTGSVSITLDLGGGGIFHGGTVLGGMFSPSFVKEWDDTKNTLRYAAAFNTTDSIYQSFYFKNPGEKAIIDDNYYGKLGADQMMRPYLGDIRTATPLLKSGFQVYDKDRKMERSIAVTAADSYREKRDKRSQVISYLTAEDADRVGLDKFIYSFKENTFQPGSCYDSTFTTRMSRYNYYDPGFYRKAHHISQVNVLEPDGRNYVFGIPVYQVRQKEVTFSTEKTPLSDNQLITYTDENHSTNKKGRDGFFQSETMKGYAHSFLLTGILSPDYVDVTGDGISDDDLGTAIRFNYSRVDRKKTLTGENYWNNFKWRMPAAANAKMANYNEGLKADSRDDKGMYTYGEKELWYLHSIESKNMVATFHVAERHDGKQVINEDGGRNNNAPGQKLLRKINLYTKSDFLKYGSAARAVKTVHFEYKYSTCPNYPLNDGAVVDKYGNILDPDYAEQDTNINKDKGKLTLVALWFSYNGNDKQVKNRYVFKYTATVKNINANPSYNAAETDRWGSYKPHSVNPQGVGNNDYPYAFQPHSIQNTDTSNAYAAAWNLEKILLPGGAVVKVDYEADDYAYVQDKRASQMTRIAGFGLTKNSTPVNRLYTTNFLQLTTPGLMDHRFVFFHTPQASLTKQQIAEKYLQDFKQLLLKLWVKMPKGNIGADPAFEAVTVYGAIKDYGPTSNPNIFYVELSPARNGGSPIMETVLQFLKQYLPSRAYPGYEVNGDGALLQLVRSVFGLMNSFTQGVQGFEKDLKVNGKCKEADLGMSFARLHNPYFKKIGGGHRVKKVTISDSWDRMTQQYESVYGQEYNYTTTEIIDNQKTVISSGVASYEPGVGNEENPFREVLKYSETQFLGPTDHSNVELPFAETFFPSPMVGYSKVGVRSIHNKTNKKIKSGTGLQQTEFYTTRDFPVISEFTDMDPESRHHHKPGLIEQVFNFKKKDYLTLTQGFRIVLNDMNGKIKSQTSYAENDSINPVNYTENHYRVIPRGNNKFRLDNTIPVISGADGKITNKLIGKDIEVMNDFREHFSYTYAANIPLNAEFFTVANFPVLIPTIFRMAFRDESMFRSATTLKVVNEYGILDSVVNIDKGSMLSTKNLVYDAETGDVLVSRTNNEFRKPVYQFRYPAWWVHTGMEPAYRNIDLTYSGVLFRNGRIEESNHVNMARFESGDEIYVTHTSDGVAESAGCIKANYPSTIAANYEYRIWAVDIRKDQRNTQKEFIFLDRYGNPYNATNATIRVIRSGKRNLAGTSSGNIVSLSSPIRTVSGQQRIVIDDTTDVLNASAAEFKERWRVNDMFYAVDTVVRTIRKIPIVTNSFYPTASHSLEYLRKRGRNEPHNPYHYPSPNYFVARQHDEGGNHTKYNQKSWLNFDFAGITASSTILSAKLSIQSHTIPHTFPDGQPSHATHNPHVSFDNHRNDFRISRMFSAWPSSNAGWEAAFNVEPGGSANQVFKKGTPPQSSLQSYLYYPGISPDERIEMTALLSSMIKDKFERNYATGIKLSLDHIATVDRPSRVCFHNGASGHGYQRPSIDVKYFTCNTTDEPFYKGVIANAPVYPPADTTFCIADTVGRVCFSVFSKKQMNPYIEGILGNWRSWKSYVYYGERRESDPTVPTDIRKDGIIKEFEKYWVFTDSQLARSYSSKWVWNAEITQYNRKGAELEDHDPLDRYNAGIYGYQETLPVAVINNSRLRLSAFDGFEDYYYKDDPCEPYCKPSKRHFNTGLVNKINYLIDSQSHSGKYSVRIGKDSAYQMAVMVSANDTVATPDLRIKMVRTPYTDTLVTPNGIGLRGTYYNSTNFTGFSQVRTPEYVDLWFDDRGNCNHDDYSDPPSNINCRNVSAKWTGKIQVEKTGQYILDVSETDDYGYIKVDGVTYVINDWNGADTRNPVTLTAGVLHVVEVGFVQQRGQAHIILQWKIPGSNSFTRIPLKNLYPAGEEDLADSTVQVVTAYCEKPDTIQAISHHLIDSFNLVPGTKMLASVWMKKDTVDCKCGSYNNSFAIRDAGNDTVIAKFVAKERIIEGWQQFEAVFTVPAINQIKLDFKALPGSAVFIDDLRLHPYNANMKSFVYDPVTLRLAAELDGNNYASFYEYDDDGGLIRVKKETREGIKTITETRSGIQKRITDL